MNPLRLALLVDPLSARLKGGEHAGGLADELARRGHQVAGFGAGPELIPGGDRIPWSAEKKRGLFGFRPDAIIAYDALSPAAWLGARAARRLGAPLILVEAGAFVRGTLLERGLWRLGRSLWGAYVRHTVARLVALDPVALEASVKEGFDRARILLLGHGVDPERFQPGLTSEVIARHRVQGRVLSYIGPLEMRTGVELLIHAFAETVGRRGDWSLVLAGRGNAQARLRATAERLGIGARVHFLGDADYANLPGILAASTLFAQPALDDGIAATGVVQAMSTGVPVLASELPRLAFLIREAECGLLVRAGEQASWTAALARATQAPEARDRWGANGRAYVEGRLAWRAVADVFERSIRETQPQAGSSPLPLAG